MSSIAPNSQRGLSIMFLRRSVVLSFQNHLDFCEYDIFALVHYRNSSIEVAFECQYCVYV